MVRSLNAEWLFVASFVVAEATVRAIVHLKPAKVTFVITGRYSDGEDRACAEYLEACLREQTPDPEPYLERVRNASELLHMPIDQFPHIASDIDYCTRLDVFSFAMPVSREQNRSVMRAVVPASRISTLGNLP